MSVAENSPRNPENGTGREKKGGSRTVSKNRRTTGHFPVHGFSDDLQIIPGREGGKRLARERLVPVGNRTDIVLSRIKTTVAPPSERLDRDFQIVFKTDGIHDMPAIHGVTVLRLIESIRSDDLMHSHEGG